MSGTAEQEERAKWRANERADNAEARLEAAQRDKPPANPLTMQAIPTDSRQAGLLREAAAPDDGRTDDPFEGIRRVPVITFTCDQCGAVQRTETTVEALTRARDWLYLRSEEGVLPPDVTAQDAWTHVYIEKARAALAVAQVSEPKTCAECERPWKRGHECDDRVRLR